MTALVDLAWAGLAGLAYAVIRAELDYLVPGIRASWWARKRAS